MSAQLREVTAFVRAGETGSFSLIRARTPGVRARQILGDLDNAEKCRTRHRRPRGMWRGGVSGAFGIREVTPRLPGFAAQHPKLGIELMMSNRPENLIAEGGEKFGGLAAS
jgi:hypothetical protein